jgi:hypothetical protein
MRLYDKMSLFTLKHIVAIVNEEKSGRNIIKLIKIMSEDKLIRTPVYRDMSLCHT